MTAHTSDIYVDVTELVNTLCSSYFDMTGGSTPLTTLGEKAFALAKRDDEIFKFYAVPPRIADALEHAGERVEKDFAGMCVWAKVVGRVTFPPLPKEIPVIALDDYFP